MPNSNASLKPTLHTVYLGNPVQPCSKLSTLENRSKQYRVDLFSYQTWPFSDSFHRSENLTMTIHFTLVFLNTFLFSASKVLSTLTRTWIPFQWYSVWEKCYHAFLNPFLSQKLNLKLYFRLTSVKYCVNRNSRKILRTKANRVSKPPAIVNAWWSIIHMGWSKLSCINNSWVFRPVNDAESH